MTPKELDKLFRQGSERHDFEYNPEAWEQMEALLDKDKRRRRLFWWCFGIAAACLLAASIWVLLKGETENFSSGTSSPNKEQPDHSGGIANPLDETRKNAFPATPPPGDSLDFSKPEKAASPPPDFAAPEQKTEQDNPGRSFNREEKSPPALPPIPIAGSALPENPGNTPEVQARQDSLPGSTVQNPAPPSDTVAFNETNTFESRTSPDLPFLPLGLPAVHSDHAIQESLEFIQLNEDPLPAAINSIKPLEKDNALLIGLLFAPEAVISGSDHFKVSWKVGGRIEYRYGGKFSTSVGVSYIRKKYEAGAGKYTPGYGFWTRKIAPKSIYGSCKVLEVPVLVGFFPRGYYRSGFYAAVGLTSYFMLQEWYQYSYDLPDTDLIRSWGTEHENRHWFGIGQVTMGYNVLLNRRMSLQFAPYLLVPLTGVGHGKVKLWSVGISAGFNFQVN